MAGFSPITYNGRAGETVLKTLMARDASLNRSRENIFTGVKDIGNTLGGMAETQKQDNTAELMANLMNVGNQSERAQLQSDFGGGAYDTNRIADTMMKMKTQDQTQDRADRSFGLQEDQLALSREKEARQLAKDAADAAFKIDTYNLQADKFNSENAFRIKHGYASPIQRKSNGSTNVTQATQPSVGRQQLQNMPQVEQAVKQAVEQGTAVSPEAFAVQAKSDPNRAREILSGLAAGTQSDQPTQPTDTSSEQPVQEQPVKVMTMKEAMSLAHEQFKADVASGVPFDSKNIEPKLREIAYDKVTSSIVDTYGAPIQKAKDALQGTLNELYGSDGKITLDKINDFDLKAKPAALKAEQLFRKELENVSAGIEKALLTFPKNERDSRRRDIVARSGYGTLQELSAKLQGKIATEQKEEKKYKQDAVKAGTKLRKEYSDNYLDAYDKTHFKDSEFSPSDLDSKVREIKKNLSSPYAKTPNGLIAKAIANVTEQETTFGFIENDSSLQMKDGSWATDKTIDAAIMQDIRRLVADGNDFTNNGFMPSVAQLSADDPNYDEPAKQTKARKDAAANKPGLTDAVIGGAFTAATPGKAIYDALFAGKRRHQK